jgi:hypothetical protein
MYTLNTLGTVTICVFINKLTAHRLSLVKVRKKFQRKCSFFKRIKNLIYTKGITYTYMDILITRKLNKNNKKISPPCTYVAKVFYAQRIY